MGKAVNADPLSSDDADQLLELADRCGRAATTARRLVPANESLADRLLTLAANLDLVSEGAREIAGIVDPYAGNEDDL